MELGTEVGVLNSQVVPISQVVLRIGFTVYSKIYNHPKYACTEGTFLVENTFTLNNGSISQQVTGPLPLQKRKHLTTGEETFTFKHRRHLEAGKPLLLSLHNGTASRQVRTLCIYKQWKYLPASEDKRGPLACLPLKNGDISQQVRTKWFAFSPLNNGNISQQVRSFYL